MSHTLRLTSQRPQGERPGEPAHTSAGLGCQGWNASQASSQFAFAAGVQAILHQDFPTREMVCVKQKGTFFLVRVGEGGCERSCTPKPARVPGTWF